MSWQCIELILPADQEDYFGELFDQNGALSVTTSSADETLIFEIDGQVSSGWTSIKLTALFEEDADLNVFVKQLCAHDNLRVDVKQLEDRNWEQCWLENFKPLRINENLWICPSWYEPVDPRSVTVQIDPGMSFGTGTHESTHLCLQWLSEMNLKTTVVLDYGCGSGILAIAALKLGAKRAVATDIEPRSLAISLENAEKNNVNQAFEVYLPDEMPEIQTNLVIANILATTIVDLAQVLTNHTAPHGQLLLSGILRGQEQLVMDALNSFTWQSRYDGDWVALLGKK